MINIINFFHGANINNLVNDGYNRNINTIYYYNNEDLERDHKFIQWIFPTPRISNFNNLAPILSIQEIRELKKDITIINWLKMFKYKMFVYWGLIDDKIGDISLLNGHNGLRLSRAIECLTLFEIDISEIFNILNKNIKNDILNPYMIEYENKKITLWEVRYIESIKIR